MNTSGAFFYYNKTARITETFPYFIYVLSGKVSVINSKIIKGE